MARARACRTVFRVKNALLTGPWPRRTLSAAAIAAALTLVASASAGRDPICFNHGATVCGVFSTLPRDSVNCATTSSMFAWDWSQWYMAGIVVATMSTIVGWLGTLLPDKPD